MMMSATATGVPAADVLDGWIGEHEAQIRSLQCQLQRWTVRAADVKIWVSATDRRLKVLRSQRWYAFRTQSFAKTMRELGEPCVEIGVHLNALDCWTFVMNTEGVKIAGYNDALKQMNPGFNAGLREAAVCDANVTAINSRIAVVRASLDDLVMRREIARERDAAAAAAREAAVAADEADRVARDVAAAAAAREAAVAAAAAAAAAAVAAVAAAAAEAEMVARQKAAKQKEKARKDKQKAQKAQKAALRVALEEETLAREAAAAETLKAAIEEAGRVAREAAAADEAERVVAREEAAAVDKAAKQKAKKPKQKIRKAANSAFTLPSKNNGTPIFSVFKVTFRRQCIP